MELDWGGVHEEEDCGHDEEDYEHDEEGCGHGNEHGSFVVVGEGDRTQERRLEREDQERMQLPREMARKQKGLAVG